MINQVWYVTGASKGLGLALVKQLLEKGYRVAATSRNLSDLKRVVGETTAQFLPLEVDLVNEESVKASISNVLQHFGGMDVVVNNAGYGQFGTMEELSDEEVRRNYDVNVFGFLNVIRNAMPLLRARKSGHIFNISSIGGYSAGYAGWGIYCSTKFAVSAISEGLASEAKPFGIHVTNVYPGYFRTNFLSEGSIILPANPIEDYLDARQSQDFHQNQMNGNQPGDPIKGMEALIQVAQASNPPLHLFLGADAVQGARNKMAEVTRDVDMWEALSVGTGY